MIKSTIQSEQEEISVKVSNRLTKIYDKNKKFKMLKIKSIKMYGMDLYLASYYSPCNEWQLRLNLMAQPRNNQQDWLNKKKDCIVTGYVLVSSPKVQEKINNLCDMVADKFCREYNLPLAIIGIISIRLREKVAVFKAFKMNKERTKVFKVTEIQWKSIDDEKPIGKQIKDYDGIYRVLKDLV